MVNGLYGFYCRHQPPENQQSTAEFLFPQLIVVPLSTHEVDGVRKEKEGLTATGWAIKDPAV